MAEPRLRGPEDCWCTIDGVPTHYVTCGQGAPLVLVHGWGGSWITFRRVIRELARERRVYALDLPGHGASSFPSGADFKAETGARFLCRFLDEVVREPAALAGISAGGLLSLLAADQRPDLVTHLVLVSSAGLGRDVSWTLRVVTFPGMRPFVEQVTPTSVRLALSRQLYDRGLITDELVDTLYRERQTPGNRRALLLGLRRNLGPFGIKRWRHHARALSRLAIPVLIVWGRQDRLIPLSHAFHALRAVHHAQLRVFDRCGHWPPYERPEEFNSAVREFLG